MLLALYCLPTKGEQLTITSLSLAAGVAQTTGHRWQAILLDRGLIERDADHADGRRYYVRLTNNGRDLLERYLTRLFDCGVSTRLHSRVAVG
jgi:DNA-binding MarR family transcriptional regulator